MVEVSIMIPPWLRKPIEPPYGAVDFPDEHRPGHLALSTRSGNKMPSRWSSSCCAIRAAKPWEVLTKAGEAPKELYPRVSCGTVHLINCWLNGTIIGHGAYTTLLISEASTSTTHNGYPLKALLMPVRKHGETLAESSWSNPRHLWSALPLTLDWLKEVHKIEHIPWINSIFCGFLWIPLRKISKNTKQSHSIPVTSH